MAIVIYLDPKINTRCVQPPDVFERIDNISFNHSISKRNNKKKYRFSKNKSERNEDYYLYVSLIVIYFLF